MSKTKRVVKELMLGEVSEVDRPAQEGALAVIMKAEDAPRAQAIAKAYLDPMDGAQSFTAFFENEAQQKAYWEAQEKVRPAISALRDAMTSIVGDADLSSVDKQSRATQAAMDYLNTLRALLPEVQDELMEAVDKASNGAGETVSEKEQSMPDSNAEVAKQLADLQTEVTTLKAERDEAVAKAAMSDAEKAYMSGLDAEAQKAFMAMKPEDRARKMKKSADEDETVQVEGQTVAKSKVGPEAFAIFKAQATRLEAIEKQAAADRAEAELTRLEKRASDEFAHLPGKATEVAKALRAIEAIKDEDVRKSILDVFATAEKTIAAGFAERGHSDGTTAKSATAFNAKVQEVAKAQDLPQHEAMSLVRKQHPDLYDAAFGSN